MLWYVLIGDIKIYRFMHQFINYRCFSKRKDFISIINGLSWTISMLF